MDILMAHGLAHAQNWLRHGLEHLLFGWWKLLLLAAGVAALLVAAARGPGPGQEP